MQTERVALFVVAPTQTGEGILIAGMAARDDGAQGFQFLVNEAEDVIEAFSSVADDLIDKEVRKTVLQVSEAGDGLEMIVPIGGDEGARQGPVGEQTVVNDVKALGLVAKVMCAAGA
jgi:hypothetical protein